MSATIESNANALAVKLGACKGLVKEGLTDGLDEAADIGVRTMKASHNPFSKTGDTLRSIKKITTGEFSRSLGPMTDKLVPLFLEKGTKPHIIIGKPYLAFEGKNGKVILGRKLKNGTRPGIVHHPGTTPRPFVQPAYNTLRVMFPNIIATHVKNSLN